jgi:hypothetical protein
MKGVFPDIDADVRDDDICIDGDHDGVLQMPEWLARRYIRWHSQHEETHLLRAFTATFASFVVLTLAVLRSAAWPLFATASHSIRKFVS